MQTIIASNAANFSGTASDLMNAVKKRRGLIIIGLIENWSVHSRDRNKAIFETATQSKDAEFLFVDVEQNSDIKKQFPAASYPYLLFFTSDGSECLEVDVMMSFKRTLLQNKISKLICNKVTRQKQLLCQM